MTHDASTGPASRWPLPDPRPDGQRESDSEAVRRQVEVLTLPNTDPEARARLDDVVERILRRQRSARDRGATPFVRVPSGSGRTVLVAENELVIRAGDRGLAHAREVLGAYTPRAGRADRPVAVHQARNARDHDKLRADAKRLRDQDVGASLNPIVPLGYVIKGDAFPGMTAVQAGYAPGPAGPIDTSVRVAIVDTGLVDLTAAAQQRTDSWLTPVVPAGTDELNIVAPLDRNDWFSGHGTFTAGVVRQVAPTCEIVVYRFTGPDGIGTDVAAADALIRAADEGAGRRLIINASFGVPAVDGVPPVAMQQAVEYIADRYPEVLIVASAGNDGDDEKLYPAAFPGVIAVGALHEDLTPATFSNHGEWVRCSTVGVGVVSTFVAGKLPPEANLKLPDGDNRTVPDVEFGQNAWAAWSGTSFTAPQIGAAVASLCAEDPALTPGAAFQQLIDGRPTLDGYGAKIHILRGTPV